MRTVEGSFATARNGRALWLTLAVLLALVTFTEWADRPPAALPAHAPAAMFSATRAARVLQDLVGTGIPHPLASTADAVIREKLVRRLNALGIATELQEGWVCDVVLACGRIVNIIGHIEGSEPASAGVLLAAHYDSVPAGPGAGDDGIGVASVLEIARVLKQQPARRHPVILLIDEGEEAGLLGARLFVAERAEAHTIRAAVNLDARGDSGPSLMFETGAATDWSLRMFAAASARPMSNSLYYFVYKLLPNDTDFTVFKAAGYEGFNFALIGDVERYHTPQDRFENVDLASLQHQGQNALSVVQALAMADLSSPPARRAVFFDLFSRSLWHWPASWSPWLGLILTGALFYALWGVRRRAGVPIRGIVHAFAALTLGCAGAALVSALLLALVRARGAVPPAAAYSWAGSPDGMHAASIALALLAPACAARFFRGSINAWSLWLAYLILQALLALLCSVLSPELSYLFLCPVVAGAIAALLAMQALRNAPSNAPLPPFAAALPLIGCAITFTPILLLLYPALGADAWPIITALCGLAALGLAPQLAQSPARTYRLYAGVAAATVILGGGVTLLMPPYTAQMPQRTLLWYLLDADSGRAAWLLQPDSKRLPPQFALHATQRALQAPLPAGNISGAVASIAPPEDYAAPQMQILSVENRARGVRYHLRVRSLRNAPEIELAIADDRTVAATLDLGAGHTVPAHFWRAKDGSRWLQLIGMPSEGLDLTIETSTAADLAVTVLDRSYGLPTMPDGVRSAKSLLTTQSQDGDLTIVYRSVHLSATETSSGS